MSIFSLKFGLLKKTASHLRRHSQITASFINLLKDRKAGLFPGFHAAFDYRDMENKLNGQINLSSTNKIDRSMLEATP
jgi:hypothetical protein